MQNQEILAVIILSALLGLLLIIFIVTILFMYQKRQHIHKKELAIMQDEYKQQILRVQFEMQEATLKEISEKLHDTLKNKLVAIQQHINVVAYKLSNKTTETNDAVILLTQYALDVEQVKDEIRLTSHSLSTDRIMQVGLVDAIKYEAKRIAANGVINVIFTADETYEYNFEETNAIYLFRMFQEIIGNVLTHSKATTVEIVLGLIQPNIFLLQVNDNGIGFNIAEKKKSKQSGLGLASLYKRALQMQAIFTINSNVNQGTNIKITLPLTTIKKIKIDDSPKKTPQNTG